MLEELNLKQDNATIIYEDNDGALLMKNVQKPTLRARHLDIKYFSLLDWFQLDLMLLQTITTPDNVSDALTKALSSILFWHHNIKITGMRAPSSANSI